VPFGRLWGLCGGSLTGFPNGKFAAGPNLTASRQLEGAGDFLRWKCLPSCRGVFGEASLPRRRNVRPLPRLGRQFDGKE